jgi:hypothetical protein
MSSLPFKVYDMKIDSTQSSEWGNFTLIPSDGWKISSNTFVDYESGLLIVRETPVDISHIQPNEFGSRVIPQNTYVIDLTNLRMLEPEEWRPRFDYRVKEFLVENTPFRIVRQRKAPLSGANDYIEEKLVDQETGNVLYYQSGVAFRDKKPKSVYELYLEREERIKRQKEKEASELSLEQFYFREWERLKEGDVLLQYYDRYKTTFRFLFSDGVFLLQEGGKLPDEVALRKEIQYHTVQTFPSASECWNHFSRNQNWYLENTPFFNNLREKLPNGLFARPVIHQANAIRHQIPIPGDAYRAIRLWENAFDLSSLHQSEQLQVCPNCRSNVRFDAGYLNYICNVCTQLLTDQNGRRVDFYNTSMSGGCQGYYLDTKEKYEGDDCYIGKKKFRAAERRFGGIVVWAVQEKS